MLRGMNAAPVKLPVFRDISSASGLAFVNSASPTSQKYLPESMTGGVAVFDYDGDGRMDLFFVNGAKLSDPMANGHQPDKTDPRYWNRLYRNEGNGSFTDVTEKAGLPGTGYGMGAAVGDYNNDGHADLFVTNLGRSTLYRNNGDGTFTDVTEKSGVITSGWCAGACFFDYDKDGHLDLFVSRYLEWDFSKNIWCGERKEGFRSFCHPDKFQPVEHLLYRNNGDGTFTDVSRQAGLERQVGKGLGVVVDDFDSDGWPDIAVANDSFPQQFFRNQQNGKFKESGIASGLAYDGDARTFAGMGIDSAFLTNGEGPEIFIDALANQHYALFRYRNGFFEYESGESGLGKISALHSGWGAKFADMDNDGWKDLVIAQGHVMDNIELTQPWVKYREPPALLRNRNGRFEDISPSSGKPFQIPLSARGLAVGDLDNDGCLDVAINCNNGPAVVLRNEGGTGNNWILIDTVGTVSNRDGIGARVTITTPSGLRQRAFVTTAGSYLSASSKRVHFGLGLDASIAELEIAWPSGILQTMKRVKANQILTVTESSK
ncbi:MAG: CRTAC1 family protein [Bryobacteraceae bacterium]|nr:CRTAC1 family protein [Bryobacteraceae bacterium]